MRRFRVQVSVARWWLGVFLVIMGAMQESAAQELPPPAAGDLKKMSLEDLMDIEVTSVSKRPQKLSVTASAIQVVTNEDIRRSGATSLPEALRLAGNLEVAQIDSRQWAITARGFNNVFADKMLVLIDGRSVYTPLYAGVYWDVQNLMLEDVDRAEVISGPGATQWGSNAVNGVINITTKSAKDTQGGLLVEAAGNELNDLSEVRYGGKIAPGVYYRVYGTYSEIGSSVLPSGGGANDSWRIGQGGFRVDAEKAASNNFTLQGDIYDGSATRAGPDDIHIAGGNVLGRWSKTFSEVSDLKLQLYYDYTHRVIPGSFTQDVNTYDLDFQNRRRWGQYNDFLWGLGYRLVDDEFVNTPANAFLPPTSSLQTFNGFAQDEISWAEDHWHFTVGSKLEHNDYTGFEVEPSGRLAWTPSPSQTIWSAISRAVRTPSRIDRDLYSPATPPYRIAGGPNVVSEKLLSYELGYRLQVNPRLLLSIAGFYNDYSDLRSLLPLQPPAAFPVEVSSGLNGKSSGAEFSADWRLNSRWRLHGGYTELRTSSHPQPGSFDRSSRGSIARDPNHQAQLRSVLDLAKNLEADAGLRYVGPITSQSVPGYTDLDVRLGWQPTENLSLTLTGQNLLHNYHAEFNPPGSRRAIQHSFYGKATWRF